MDFHPPGGRRMLIRPICHTSRARSGFSDFSSDPPVSPLTRPAGPNGCDVARSGNFLHGSSSFAQPGLSFHGWRIFPHESGFQNQELPFLLQQCLDLAREVGGFDTGILDRRARHGFRMSGNAWPLVADFGHVGGKQNGAAGGDEFADFFAVPCEEIFGLVDALELRAEALREDFPCHDPVAFTAGVDTVPCQHECGVLGPAGLESSAHWRMDVHDVPAFGAFAKQPPGVSSEVFIMCAGHAVLLRIMDGRRAEHNALRTGFQDRIPQRGAGVAKALRSAFVGRQG